MTTKIYVIIFHERTGIPCFIVFCFFVLCRDYILYKSEVCGDPTASKSIGAIFPKAFAHFVSLSHVLVLLTILQTLSLLQHLLW